VKAKSLLEDWLVLYIYMLSDSVPLDNVCTTCTYEMLWQVPPIIIAPTYMVPPINAPTHMVPPIFIAPTHMVPQIITESYAYMR